MIILDYRDRRPIYEQVISRFQELMLTGALEKDSQLPSVRSLAMELAINPNTIAKAFRELEQEGYIYTITGRGSFAADRKDISAGRNDELLKKFDEIVKELLFLSEDKEQLKERIEVLAKGGGKDDSDQ